MIHDGVPYDMIQAQSQGQGQGRGGLDACGDSWSQLGW